MDYYNNEMIVEKQKENLKPYLTKNKTLRRDAFERFVIDNDWTR